MESSNLYLKVCKFEGLRVELHPPNTTAYPYGNGFYLSAGQMTSVGMTTASEHNFHMNIIFIRERIIILLISNTCFHLQLRVERKGRPYGFCIDLNNAKLLDENYPHIAKMKDLYKLSSYSAAVSLD